MKKLLILILLFFSSCYHSHTPEPGETWKYCKMGNESDCREMFILNVVNDDVEYVCEGKIWHENIDLFMISSKKISK